MKVLVVGYSRGFSYDDVVRAIENTEWPITSIQILSKGNRGIDNYTSKYALDKGIHISTVGEDVDGDNSAIFKILMRGEISGADAVLAFWDGDSRKTVDVVGLVKSMGKLIYIYDKEECYESSV